MRGDLNGRSAIWFHSESMRVVRPPPIPIGSKQLQSSSCQENRTREPKTLKSENSKKLIEKRRVLLKICTGSDRIVCTGFYDFIIKKHPTYRRKNIKNIDAQNIKNTDAKTSKISTQKHHKYRRKNIKNFDVTTSKICTQKHQKYRSKSNQI